MDKISNLNYNEKMKILKSKWYTNDLILGINHKIKYQIY